jgi:hypothetical protein
MPTFEQVNDYVMNMINSIGDDMNIVDFRRLWLSKNGEFGEMFKKKITPKDSVEKEPSAYVKFCRDHRQQVKDSNTEMKGVDITRELARLWKLEKGKGPVQESKKEVVEKGPVQESKKGEKVKGIKTKVIKAVKPKVIKETISKVNKVTRRKKKEVEDPDFIEYCNENRIKMKEKYPVMSPLEITRELAKEWKEQRINRPEEIRINYDDNRDEIRNIINEAMGL